MSPSDDGTPTTHTSNPKNKYRRVGARIAAWTALAAAVVLLSSAGVEAQPAAGAPPTTPRSSPSRSSHLVTQAGHDHQLVIYDEQQKTIAVYQIHPTTGAITLASVRNIAWDLRMEEFNSDKPTPASIRQGIEATR